MDNIKVLICTIRVVIFDCHVFRRAFVGTNMSVVGRVERHHFFAPLRTRLDIGFFRPATRQYAFLVTASFAQEEFHPFWSYDCHVKHERRLYGVENDVEVENRVVSNPREHKQRQIDHHDRKQFGKYAKAVEGNNGQYQF